MKILVTGAAGQLARHVVDLLSTDNELIGADVRPLPPGRLFPGEFVELRYTQRRMADIFRQFKPEALVHMGRIRSAAISFSQRFDQNVLGTRHLLELSLKYGVRRVVVLSTFHVYGAHQHNHTLIEEDAPLRASQVYRELADAVELDHAAQTFLWRYRRVETAVLRPVNMIGPTLRNMMSALFRSSHCPVLMGYDPMMQFLHEEDAAQAISLAVRGSKWGIFNVAGEGAVPYSEAIRLAGSRSIPIPYPMAGAALAALSRWNVQFPRHLIDFFRYPTVISDALFRKSFDFSPQYTTVEALKSVRI